MIHLELTQEEMIASMFTAENLMYSEALNLIEALKQENIYASITTGGVAIQCTPDQINRAREICLQLGASFNAGYSGFEKHFMLRHGSLDHVEEVTGNMIALIKEWELAIAFKTKTLESPDKGTPRIPILS